jgi:OmpA-OmpF porin, OOP family
MSSPNRRAFSVRLVSLSLALTGLSMHGAAAAQGAPPAEEVADGEFSVQRFEPEPGPRNFLGVAGARTDGDLTWSAALFFDYQHDPFVITSCVSSSDCSDPNAQATDDFHVVKSMYTWNALASFTPIAWAQIGLRVPVAYATGDGIPTASNTGETLGSGGLSAVGLGDLTLEGKFRVFGEPDDLFTLGAAAELSAPTGHATSDGSYIGNSTPITGGIRAIADVKYEGFVAAANLRGVFKENAKLGDTTLGPEFRWGAALGYQVHELFRPIVEAFGSTAFSTTNGTNALEIDGGIQITPLDGELVITAAGGTGIIKGVGVPIGRAIVGVGFYYDHADDEDSDGIANDVDQCVSDAEDPDQVEDSDGCPEDDADHDKILDELDKCPIEAETENNFKDDDGCPDKAVDSDKDGFLDEVDKCPTVAGKMARVEFVGCPDSDQDGVPDQLDKCNGEGEDTDGFEDLDGCLDPDNDGDGVLDTADECGDDPETMNGVDDGDGCPDYGRDNDNDGLDDEHDQCPNQPEVLNGNEDGDGCPDGTSLVDMKPTRVAFVKPIVFAGNDVTDAQSLKAIQGLANGLKNWPQILQIEIAVSAADAAQAEARAKAIVDKVVAAGIGAHRLVAKGVAGSDGVVMTVLKAPPKP